MRLEEDLGYIFQDVKADWFLGESYRYFADSSDYGFVDVKIYKTGYKVECKNENFLITDELARAIELKRKELFE